MIKFRDFQIARIDPRNIQVCQKWNCHYFNSWRKAVEFVLDRSLEPKSESLMESLEGFKTQLEKSTNEIVSKLESQTN